MRALPKSSVSVPSAAPAPIMANSSARAAPHRNVGSARAGLQPSPPTSRRSRVAGLGVVKQAQHSGRAIYSVAIASSRRIELDNWDRSAIILPFSRMGLVAGKPIYVPSDAKAAALQVARRHLECELNRVTARAYEIADRKGSLQP